MQEGQIFRKGASWFVRFRELRPVLRSGKPGWRQVCKRLAPFDKKCGSRRAVAPLASKILAPVNAGTLRPESRPRLRDFVEYVYVPHGKEHQRSSTPKGSRDLFRYHLKKRLGDIRGRDFRTVTGENWMADIAGETGLSNTSIKHVQSFLSGVFTLAQRQGALDSANPRRDVSLPEAARVKKPTLTVWRKSGPCSASCPSRQRTVVATAAFAGRRRSELRGLRRHDFAGDERRGAGTVWENQVSDRTKTKTRASAAAVPVLPILRKALEEHRRRVPQDGYIFAGEQKGGALNLGNLVTRTIKPALQGCRVEWRGWHAYRRGLATNLYRLGVQDKTMQVILRPANISATLSVCVKSAPADAHAAMQRLEDAWSASVQQSVQLE